MDSWTLKGDSYSFLRSAPRTISLRNREGTPNHVEIFDITNIPSPRTAISETTCLCDIFGDDRESPSLSSSPASVAFVPPSREVDRGAAASPLVDDSSGSYHTANGSSEGEEGFDDPKERLRSPTLPTAISEGEESEGHNQTSEHSGLSEETPKLGSVASLPLPPLSTETASLEVLKAVSTSRTPSPRHYSPETLKSAEDRGISSSPSSSLSSHQASSPSHSPQPSNLGASLSSIESQHTPSLSESSGSPKGSLSSSGSRKSSLSSEQRPQSSDHLRGLTPATFEPRVIFSSNSTSRSSVDIYRQSGERSTTPESRDYSYSPDTQDCSPFSELRGRVSVHDLFSRGSTPDIEGSPCTPELVSCTSLAGGDTPENQDSLSAEAKSAASPPLPRYTPPTPVSPIARTPECRGRSVSPAVRYISSPALSLGVPHTSPSSDSPSQALSPVPYSLSSREVSSDYCPIESDYTSSSPEIRVTASSPEVRSREESLEENLELNSEDHSQCSRATASSPHITGLCYSVIQPKDRDTYTEIAHLSTSEPIWWKPRSPEPKCKAPVKQIEPRTGQEESTVTIVTPDEYYKYSDPEPNNIDSTELPQPRSRSLSPEPLRYTPSPELRHQGPSPETRPYSPLPEQRDLASSPDTIHHYPLPETRNLFPLPEKREDTPSPELRYLAPSPGKIHYTPSPEPIHFETQPSPSPDSRSFSSSPKVQHYSYSPEPSYILPAPEKRQLTPSSEPRNLSPSTEKRQLTPSPQPRNFPPSPEKRQLTPSPQPRNFPPSPEKRQLTPSPQPRNFPPSPEKRQLSPSPQPRDPSLSPEKRQLSPSPQPRDPTSSPGKRPLTDSLEPRNLPLSPEKRQLTPLPQPRDLTSSPDKIQLTPSPGPRDPTPSPEKSQFTPSPQPRDLTPSPENSQFYPSPQPRDLTPSPENSQLSPSPQPRDHTSSPEKSQFTPSPLPRDPTPSPEKSQFTPSPQPRDPTPSPVNIHNTPSPEPIHFTNTSPLDGQYSPMCEPKHTIFSPKEKEQIQSPGHIQYPSSPVSNHLVPPPEITFRNLSPEQRYQSLSPASRHRQNHITSPDPTLPNISPEPRLNQPLPDLSYRNLSPDTRHHTPSPRHLVSSHKPSLPSPLPVAEHLTPSPQPRHIFHPPSSRHHSPQITLSQSPEYRSGQRSPSAEPRCNPCITGSPLHNVKPFSTPQLSLFPQETPEMGESSALNLDLPNYSQTAVDRKSARLQTNSVVKPPGERKSSRTPEQHSEPREIPPKETYLQSSQSNYFIQKEDQNRKPLIEIQSPFHGLPVSSVEGQPDILRDRQAAAISPVQRGKEPNPKFPINSTRSDKNKNSETSCKPDHTRKQPTTKVVILSREEPAEDMAHNVSKRRTPSPPITRFTPVHIIAPEKPYRLWQNRCRRPPQVAASTLTDNFKNQMTKWGSPGITHRNSNNQVDWLGQERQMEMAREIPLEAGSKRGTDPGREQPKCTRREMESERKREEQLQEKREGRKAHASYRGQQVELSFSARNRKGPESHSTASTGKQTSKGMLTAHSYSERLPATRQPQQQQRRGGPTRRLQPSVPLNMNVASGRVSKNRPRQSSSSSMGSELDEADSEVKWFTDGAFHSLSSPEIDYLDMYNSSHRSSTNISQPSTQESPAGASASLLAYADFRGSGQRLDNEDFPFQPTTYYSDGLDPAKRYEMGSFECVDVAVEREEPRKGRRGVPKRQIQLKRKNTLESRQDESSENGSPVVPGIAVSPSFQGSLKETLLRQHSTPVTMHESYHCEPSTDIPEHNKKTCKLQKSTSLDETHPKTKMATCLIKSVLSKKMQSVDREEPKGEGTFSSHEEKPSSSVQAEETLEKPTQNDTLNLSSSLNSQSSLLSADPAVGTESNTMASDVHQHFEIKSGKRSSPTVSQHSSTVLPDNKETHFHKTVERSGMRSELMVPFRRQVGGCEREEEIAASKSASTTVGNKGVHFATGSNSHMEARQEQECRIPSTEEHRQPDKSDCMSKTTEIKDGLANDKKKSSLNVSLTPEFDNKPDLHCEVPSPETSPKPSYKENEDNSESRIDVKTEEEDGNGNNKVKVPMHKVRDVRRLVKNTYNLSFKASSAAIPSPKMEEHVENEEVHQDRREEITEERKVSKNGMLEAGREDRRKEITQVSKKVMTDKQRGKLREDRVEEPKVEGRDAEHPTSTATPLEQKGRSRFHSQPMQIECKAVCLKEDKDKMTPSRIEEGKHGDQWQASAQLSVAEASKPEGYLYGGTESHMTDQTTTSKPCESDANKEPKEDSIEATPVEAKPETARRYKKPPLLGSLPKLPSKEREVSTAVVVIRDGFSKHKTVQDEGPMPATVASSESSGHAVSMLLKEKGLQAEIGAVLNEGEQNTVGGKGMPHKHVNRLEIPLQICSTSEGGVSESRRERTFSTSSAKSTPTTETPPKMGEEESVGIRPPMRDPAQQDIGSPLRNRGSQTVTPPIKLIEQKDFDALKRQDPTFPPRSPALRYRPQQIEVKSLSKEAQKQKTSTNNLMLNKTSQSIEVKSISNNQTKPAVPPKPNYKFKPPDLGPLPNESQTSAEKTLNAKPQEREERPQTIVVSSPTIYRKLSSESTSAANYTRKLAVSAVSSCRPPQNKTSTTVSSQSNSSASSDKEQSNDRAHHPDASPQSSGDTQRSTALAPVLVSATNPVITSEPGLIHGTNVSQIDESSSTVASGSGQSAVVDLNSQLQYSRSIIAHDQARTVTSNYEKQPTAVSTTRVPQYAHEQRPFHRSLSSEHPQRADDLRFYSSDDPPSYDERESFSPLMLQGLTPKKSNRYFAAPRPPPCSCTSGCPSHAGLTPPHRHQSPHNHTPPASAHSPGHPHPYPIAPPPLRPHQCRAEPPPMCYQPSSPKSSPLGPGQPLTMYHPLNQPPSYPPHPSLMQPCAPERPLQPHQHMEARRPSLHRSSQQQQHPGMSGAPYSDHGHGHSPGLTHLDPQYICGPQGMGPSYGSEYEGDGSSMYSEGSFAQTPRRMLMDPETGKYFYIEVPVQPLRKMLFDPETGQYVEVLIPQQSMSHSGLYPPTAAPYPSMHNPNMYAPAPQYMQPYAAPPPQPPPPHPQNQPPPPTRHPDSSAATALHQNGPGVVYGGPSGQGSKMDPQTHQPLDHSYLEGMYYVPTGMNASPNPPPPDCYHKHSPSPHSGAGGKRS